MKKIKNIVTIVAIASMSLFAVGCNMVQKTPEAIQKTVVAKVGDEKITMADINKELEPQINQLKEQYGEDYLNSDEVKKQLADAKKSVLNNLVTEKIFLKKADELKLTEDKDKIDEEVKKQFDEIKASFGDDDKFQEQLKLAGLTEEKFTEAIRKQVIGQRVNDYIFKDVSVSDEDVQKFYDENKETQFVDQPGAKISHILVADEDTAKEIKTKLNNGEDFAKLAGEYGTDGTKDKGGELGFIEYTNPNYDKDFMEAAKTLGEGEVSEPVKTQFGYHIIKATELKKDQVVKEFDSVKDQIKSYLDNKQKDDQYNSTLDQWKKDLKVEIHEDKLT
ncbi:peptidylprolyl isomerase [Clostridium frigidicarnis]|uniref:Foldase protein PrsA n=1 Tax=Clostridium frigidicarnis TaxID=84698 RepID=A0A1I0YLM8_9CLOT|nr:peptidylprolyl isomerase [Clostridium frigidicarnis]SFB14325.1 foldase protein PrsA [Clostridium frigidicarnis]